MKIVFFGSSKFVIPIIETLNENFDLALVITTEHESEDIVPAFCKQNSIPCISVQQLNNLIIEQLNNIKSPLAVLAFFGLIVPEEILNIFPKGIINTHPSLLPKHRGPTPVQTAILNGDKTTGTTIIKLDNEIDHGPILAQKEIAVEPDDTAETLHQRLFETGAQMLMQTLPLYLNGKIKPKEQDHSQATFTQHLTRESGYINLSSLEIGPPADGWKLEIARRIRAYYPWPGVWTKVKINNKELRIKFLPNQMIQAEGKKPMSYKDFLNGYPQLKNTLGKLLQLI